jgi:hypothetical protein
LLLVYFAPANVGMSWAAVARNSGMFTAQIEDTIALQLMVFGWGLYYCQRQGGGLSVRAMLQGFRYEASAVRARMAVLCLTINTAVPQDFGCHLVRYRIELVVLR